MGINEFLFGGRKPEALPSGMRRSDLGEDMELIQEDFYGWWKPRYLVDKRTNTKVEFMSDYEYFCTVTVEDIDWESLAPLNEDCKRRARMLSIHFPTSIGRFKNGVAEVSWQLNPDGRYNADDDGYGMTDDEEVELYGFIDRQGKVVSKFRHVSGNLKQTEQMRVEAEAVVKARRM